ncbi:M23 family metallopeptidase [Curtobacterium sp. 458]|uniref:M23 family metallopeptidase n=1 Tax=Curtobacterium sp. 458 TaxID=3050069 RepID=UPI0025B2C50A|nr:M23 family metallopeptidase [Curtobacterium sp. 458]WJX98805.1 M23 family metallopeptidase [Curtobacterium sp. 458]
MPDASTTSAPTDVTVDAPTPVVHLTRRARIEAERAAARTTPIGRTEEFAAIVGAPVDAVAPASPVDRAPASPVDRAPASPVDLAPTSPVLPVADAGPATPPAPTSPVVAPAAERAAPASPSRISRRAGSTTAPASSRRGGATARVRPARRPAAPAATAAPAPAGAAFRRTASRVTAVGALLFVAGLVVSTSLPAQALYTPEAGSTSARSAASGSAQSMSVGQAADGSTTRDQYTVSDATQYANTDASAFTNDADGTIQWPFLTGVPITSGFGGRQVAGCSFCSTNHMGVDFAPGEGTPIRVIADGVVTKVQANDGGFGNDVWVTHDVDGKQFVSVYGHMKDNTFKVVTGQQVSVGDELGEVGSTGNSTGPHLHLEIHVDGIPVDPLTWLEENAD